MAGEPAAAPAQQAGDAPETGTGGGAGGEPVLAALYHPAIGQDPVVVEATAWETGGDRQGLAIAANSDGTFGGFGTSSEPATRLAFEVEKAQVLPRDHGSVGVGMAFSAAREHPLLAAFPLRQWGNGLRLPTGPAAAPAAGGEPAAPAADVQPAAGGGGGEPAAADAAARRAKRPRRGGDADAPRAVEAARRALETPEGEAALRALRRVAGGQGVEVPILLTAAAAAHVEAVGMRAVASLLVMHYYGIHRLTRELCELHMGDHGIDLSRDEAAGLRQTLLTRLNEYALLCGASRSDDLGTRLDDLPRGVEPFTFSPPDSVRRLLTTGWPRPQDSMEAPLLRPTQPTPAQCAADVVGGAPDRRTVLACRLQHVLAVQGVLSDTDLGRGEVGSGLRFAADAAGPADEQFVSTAISSWLDQAGAALRQEAVLSPAQARVFHAAVLKGDAQRIARFEAPLSVEEVQQLRQDAAPAPGDARG